MEPVDVSPLSPPNKFCAKLITVGLVIIWKIAPVLSSLVAVGEDSFVTPSKIPLVSSFKKGAMSCIFGADLVLLDKSCHAKSSSIAVDQFNFRSFLQVLLMCAKFTNRVGNYYIICGIYFTVTTFFRR